MPKKVFLFGSYSSVSFEPETIAFLQLSDINILNNSTVYYSGTPQQILGSVVWSGLNNYVIALKTTMGLTLGVNNLSTKFDYIYPFIGGNATAHKYNLVNPLNTDAAHRLPFVGGWAHSGTGIRGNGTNSYASTFWNSLAKAGSTRVAFGGYRRTIATGGLFGSWDLNNDTRLYDFVQSGAFTIGGLGGLLNGSPRTRSHAVALNSSGIKTFSAGAVKNSYSVPTFNLISIPYYLGARNNNNVSINQYENGAWSHYWMSGAVEFTDAQMIDIINAESALQVALLRNV